MDEEEMSDEEAEELLREYANCFVGLASLVHGVDEHGGPTDAAKACFNSGFIIEIAGEWWWATAGHVIAGIEKAIGSPYATASGFHLLDRYGTGDKNSSIAFDYPNARKEFAFDLDRSIDYGAVQLPPEIVTRMQSNGIVAVPKSEWDTQDRLRYEAHFMLGLPIDAHTQQVDYRQDGYTVHGNAVPSAIHVKEMPSHHTLLPPPAYSVFIGELTSYRSGTIVGMSGGPIFGLVEGGAEHRVVAVQSAWLEDKRVTVGFPVSTLARLIEKAVTESPKGER